MVSKSVDPPTPTNFIQERSGVLQGSRKSLTILFRCNPWHPALGNAHDGISNGIAGHARRRIPSGGRSGGFRTNILFRVGSHSFFAHGFAKSDKPNVSVKELKALKRLADLHLGFSEGQLKAAQAAGELMEVERHGGNEKKVENSIPASVHKAAAGLHKAGLVDKATMRDFDVLFLTPVEALTPGQ